MQPRSRPSSPQITLPWTVRSVGSFAPSYAALCVHATDASAQRQSIVGECHGTLLAGRLGEAGRGGKREEEGGGGRRRKGREEEKGEGGRERGGRKREEEKGEGGGGRKMRRQKRKRGEEEEGGGGRRMKCMCKTETSS